jgi:cyclophilin family peptidyl-prolyl cis-trans isomerase
MFGKKIKNYNPTAQELAVMQFAKITTNKGVIWTNLYPNETPITVANFAHLANEGFYDGLRFHRVIAGFMAQGGCPHSRAGGNSGMAGTGGPDWAIECETNVPSCHKHSRGTLSMAHAGRDTGGSQFFITFVATPHLDGVHTVFGGIDPEDVDSLMTLDSIAMNDTIEKIEILKEKN